MLKIVSPRVSTAVLSVVLALGCLCADQALAQWQWKDRSGQVTASDRPPPKDVPDKDIISRPAARRVAAAPVAVDAAASAAVPASGVALAPPSKGPLDRELEARKRGAEQDAAAKARADEEQRNVARADNCRRARGQQAALDSGQRIARVNEKGEREVLDDKGRADELRIARDVISADCR